ncbi:MAG TPA: hypothetical protein PKE37_15465 [Thiomonas arsenitoxydans]|uniref:hypothetical protein n=1 Tax=Thiomonas arsenitoxydans (strain DSM 22701 / CIP 110005 / 3As) TaxID=426114 RepID=UPI002BF59E0B|nr:hypothetical protein [Thiomonas arsenitoxydans]HML83153.1 hypothetical protein [Thiomonas arsenitoxydans]
MPAPSAAAYSLAARIAARTALLNLLDAQPGAATIKFRSATDFLLATATLADPAGVVSGTTGELAFTVASQPQGVAAGEVAFVEFCDGAGVVHLAMPAQAGTSAVAGVAVLNSLAVTVGRALQVGLVRVA